MQELLIHIYIVSVGFVTAGIISSCYKLSTGRALGFVLYSPISLLWTIPAIILRLFGGPFILVRNSIRGVIYENRSRYWFAASFMIATFWSFFSGMVMIKALLHIL